MKLSTRDIQSYLENGFLFPRRVLTESQAGSYLRELESYEGKTGNPIDGKWCTKSHLVFPWMQQIMRNSSILGIVQSILGEDLMVSASQIYPKEPNSDRFISWHQDSAHWGLDREKIANVVTVWVALTDSTRANGCLRYLAGSHKLGAVRHDHNRAPDNMLYLGQTIKEPINEDKVVLAELEAGEITIHHFDLFHSSAANTTTNRRVGVAFRYITPEFVQRSDDVKVEDFYATLVNGSDRYGNFKPETVPTTTMAPEAVTFHEQITIRRT